MWTLSKNTGKRWLLLALVLSFCWSAWAQETKSGNGLAASFSPAPSLAEEVASSVKKHPDMEPLLTRILTRLDSILTKLDKPQATLINSLVSLEEKTNQLSMLVGTLQAELTTSKDSLTSSETDLAKERAARKNEREEWEAEKAGLLLQLQMANSRADKAETGQTASLIGNACQFLLNIGLGAGLIWGK